MLSSVNHPDPIFGLERVLTRALPWAFVVLAAVVVLLLIVTYYRRHIRTGGSGGRQPWTLQDLREMHARGDLADEEFVHLKARVVAESGAAPSRNGGPVGGGESDPGGNEAPPRMEEANNEQSAPRPDAEQGD